MSPDLPESDGSIGEQKGMQRSPLARLKSCATLHHGVVVMAASIAVNAGNYGYHFYASRKLGVDAYGALSSLIALIAIASVPATIFMTIIAKCTAEYCARYDDESVAALQRTVSKIILALAVAAILVSTIGGGWFTGFLHLESPRSVAVAGIAVAAALSLPVIRGTMQGREQFAALAVSFIVEALGKIICGIWLIRAGYGVFGAVMGIAVGSVLALVIHLPQHLASFVRRSGPAPNVRVLLETGAGVAITTICLTILGSFDLVFVRHFLGAHEAGIYSAISLIGRVFLFGVAFIPTVVLPKAAARAAAGLSARRVLGVASGIALAISLVEITVVALFPNVFVRALTGQAYSEAAIFMLPYCLSAIFLGFLTLATTYKIGVHRYDYVPALVICTVGEIVAVGIFHDSIAQIITVLLVGHAIALTTALLDITKPVARPIITVVSEETSLGAESRTSYV